MKVADLFGLGLLPASLNETQERLDRVAATLRPIEVPNFPKVTETDLNLLNNLAEAITYAKAAITTILALALAVNESRPELEPTVAAIDRMLGKTALMAFLSTPGASKELLKSPNSPLVERLLTGQRAEVIASKPWNAAGDMHRELTERTPPLPQAEQRSELLTAKQWNEAIERQRQLAEPTSAPQQTDAVWRERVLGWLNDGNRFVDPPIDLPDIIDVANKQFPAVALRADLPAMTVADWSRLARDGFDKLGAGKPHWTFAAALRALGFGRLTLLELGDLGSEFGVGAAETPEPGILHEFIPGGVAEFAVPPDRKAPPTFALPLGERDAYIAVVAWLIGKKAINDWIRPREP